MQSRRSLPILLGGQPPEFLVHDEEETCPYLAAERARLPLRLPARTLRGSELDERLAAGDRRNGPLLYRPACAACDACRPLRLDVRIFRPSATHRRVLRRGDRALTVDVGTPEANDERVTLYNRHLVGRGLSRGYPPIDLDGYRQFLAETCCDTFELRYSIGGSLVGVAITDRGAQALSAVYCYYDPEYARLAIGVYSILRQLALCRELGLRYLYLGLYVVGAPVMAYKSRFLPHEQRIGGVWRDIRSDDEARAADALVMTHART
jgi:arginine-tRNA-protein transferase